MSDQRQDVLRVQPHMISSIRACFRGAVNEVNNALVRLSRGGFIPEPWLGDETSRQVAVHYADRAMNGPESSYQALLAYRDQLGRVHDTLQQMEADYRRAESDNATNVGLKT